ncbi:hypothetical protein [Streptomyces sp. DASNCL29]|uniref:hypothetical protein n=1 Tax=Streptomyces sp. DASNCL29 TaxID=2583819 RepID=UPI00110FCE26|nr:hypothetical protein [Streptomyces sp. DASNCL29]TMU98894.1 hypothetical protein FGK60_14775 [Streptomyces sp. DASNCL29]
MTAPPPRPVGPTPSPSARTPRSTSAPGWGEGTPLYGPGFHSGSLRGWRTTGPAAVARGALVYEDFERAPQGRGAFVKGDAGGVTGPARPPTIPPCAPADGARLGGA